MRGYGLPRFKQLDFKGDIFNQREFALKSIYYKCPRNIIECIRNCKKCVKRKDLHPTKRNTKSKQRTRQLQKGRARSLSKLLIQQELQNIEE